jgi:hypothetical protein
MAQRAGGRLWLPAAPRLDIDPASPPSGQMIERDGGHTTSAMSDPDKPRDRAEDMKLLSDAMRNGAFKPLPPLVREALKRGITSVPIPPDVLAAMNEMREANRVKYAGLIDQARGTATSAQALAQVARGTATSPQASAQATVEAPAIAEDDPQIAAIGDVRTEIAHLAGIVAEMAATVAPLLEVAGDAYDGLIRLEGAAEGTRTALVDGQVSADNTAKKLVLLTVALVGFTVVLVLLTVVLISRA